MRCQAKIINGGRRTGSQCKREACIGVLCSIHIDYIQKIKKEIAWLKEELRRVKSL